MFLQDIFKIKKVNNIINNITQNDEISDISKIIDKMISINKSKKKIKREKNIIPYSICDKIELNKLRKNLEYKIVKYHNEIFDLIEDSLQCLESTEPSIRDNLFAYYESIYIDILDRYDLDYDKENKILPFSNKIYDELLSHIYDELFKDKCLGLERDRVKVYLESITAYVFYHCKFLIPISSNND